MLVKFSFSEKSPSVTFVYVFDYKGNLYLVKICNK